MIERKAVIQNKIGMHLKAAAEFVKVASRFGCEVTLGKDGSWVNGKSILGVSGLGAGRGATIVVRTDGKDEEEAMEALIRLIDDKFYED
jgi:phosphocarrier protein HPr